MDFTVAFVVLVYAIVIEAKEFLRTGRGDTISIPDNSEDDLSKVLALLIVEHNGDTELNPGKYTTNRPKKTKYLPWWNSKLNRPRTDSSGDSNSDEYDDSDTTDTDSNSNYYHEDDYKRERSKLISLAEFIRSQSAILRKRWRSCEKQASKVCRDACKAAYETACDVVSCKKKLKRTMKKECKKSCKEYFLSSDS